MSSSHVACASLLTACINLRGTGRQIVQWLGTFQEAKLNRYLSSPSTLESGIRSAFLFVPTRVKVSFSGQCSLKNSDKSVMAASDVSVSHRLIVRVHPPADWRARSLSTVSTTSHSMYSISISLFVFDPNQLEVTTRPTT